jgi:phosphonate transport system substrate-binding protein
VNKHFPLAILYMIIFPGINIGQNNKKADTVRFATYTYSVNNRLANLQPLANYLTERTGYQVIAVSYPSVQRLIEAISNDSVDIAMMNTSGYLILQKKNPRLVLPLVNLEMGNGIVTNYGGCLVADRSAGISSVKQLRTSAKKLSLALVASSSTSGNLVPRLLLNQENISSAEEMFKVYYAGTHKKALEEVLNGRAELSGCGCAEVDSAKARNIFDKKAVLIGSFNDIPLGPVVHSRKLSEKIVGAIGKELLQLHTENMAVFTNFCAGWTEFRQASRFQPVTDAEYDAFRTMFGDNIALWRMIE